MVQLMYCTSYATHVECWGHLFKARHLFKHLGAKQGFCWSKTFKTIIWIQSKTFVQLIWVGSKTLSKILVEKQILLFQHVGCEARLFIKNFGAKQDFLQTFWLQTKTFVETFVVQRKTSVLIFGVQTKTFFSIILDAKQDFCFKIWV